MHGLRDYHKLTDNMNCISNMRLRNSKINEPSYKLMVEREIIQEHTVSWSKLHIILQGYSGYFSVRKSFTGQKIIYIFGLK